MKSVFWLSLLLIVYTYLGYPVWLRLVVLLRFRPVRRAPLEPSVTVIMAAHDEELNLPRKLELIRRLDFPPEKLEVVVASDGSTDRTPQILLEAERSGSLRPVILQEARGKAAALNAAVQMSTGEVLVFFDVRQTVAPDVLHELCSCFADPEVGAVSGELVLEDADGQPTGDSLGLYWRVEKAVRRMESETGSVVGTTGAIYAIRRELYAELPDGTILDDVLVPMNVAKSGKRVIFQPTAIARDRIFHQPGKEFARKVRTLTGNYQLLQVAPWLLSRRNPLLFRFISHKLLRLAVPFLLVLALVSAALAHGVFYKVCFAAQMLFYALAALGWLGPFSRRFRPVAIAQTFTMLNVAAALAFVNFAVGRKRVWV